MIDITNEILTELKLNLKNVNVLTSFQSTVSKFPTIIFEELDNSNYLPTKDTGGFQHSSIAYSVEIYTRGSKRMSDAKKIRDNVDDIISSKYGLTRGRPMIVPNYLDDTIYRYRLTYTGLIDKTKTIYRG